MYDLSFKKLSTIQLSLSVVIQITHIDVVRVGCHTTKVLKTCLFVIKIVLVKEKKKNMFICMTTDSDGCHVDNSVNRKVL